MNKTLKMGFVAAFTVFTLAIMSAQADGEAPPIKGGIADLRYVKTKMTVNVSASNNTTARNADEGSGKSAETVTDTNPNEIPTTEPSTCDFGGFAQNDVVNNAYAGGASSTGVAKADIQIGYFDARVLNAYFGSNEPNPGIAYTNTGSILVSLQNIAGTNFAFSYTCAVQLTVRTFSSVDGSGTALSTYTLAKNLPGTMGPYNVWTNFSQPIDTTVRSISISGDAARWGMDQMVVTRTIPLGTNNGLTCANALSYGAGTYSIDTSNAYDDPSGNCNVKWVTFFATQNGQVNASTCGSRNYDTMLTAYTGCGTTYIARNDDYCGLGSQISFSVLAGQQYWVALGGYNCQIGLSNLTISGPIIAFRDCNSNGIPDSYDIDSAFAKDFNGNGIPDSCDITPDGSWPVAQSRNGTLVTNGGTVNTAFTGLPIAAGDVSMTFTVNADINGGSDGIEFVMFTATGSPISVTITGAQCGTEVRTISVPAATYNAALVSGTLGFAITTGPNTDSFCANTWKIDLAYSGRETDCDGNGVIDRCEIFDGSAVDQNRNGVPDSCDPFPVLRLTTNAAACNTVGSTVTVDATLSGVLNNVVAGQLLLTWDVSKLSFAAVLPGDAPYTTAYALNEQAGTIMILASTTAGGTGTTAASAVVSRIQFTVIGGSCSGTGNEVDFFTFGPMETEFTDGYGGATVPTLLASAGFVVDDGAPVLSNVPADVTVQAEAGMGSFANVALTAPTATDACAPGLTTSSSRSDGASLGAAFPVGETTVTWSATDPCGNVTRAITTVTVNNYNTGTFAVSYTNSGSYAASSARLLTLNIHGANGYTLKASQPITLVNGAGTISLTDLAVDNYDCVAIEEQGRSLRRVATMSDAGLIWSSTATLVAGDLIDDEVIDVLDWGAYIVGNPNADLDGNSVINAVDGNIIIANFGLRGETGCGTSFMGPPDPISAISVAELVNRGLTDLIGADLNNDGWLDMEDVRLAN